MKKIVLLIIISQFIMLKNNIAQEDSLLSNDNKTKPLIYFNLGFGKGFGKGTLLDIKFNYIKPSNNGISVSFNSFWVTADNEPADYYSSIFSLDIIPEFKSSNIVSVNFVKELGNLNDNARGGIEIGPSINLYQEPRFVKKTGSVPILDSNYDIFYDNQWNMGLTARFKFEFLFSRSIGIELSLLSNINKYQSILGGVIDISIGDVKYNTVFK